MSLKYTGVGTRVLNFMVDIILVSVLAYSGFKVYNWYVLYYRVPFLNFWWFFAVATFVYYTIFESIFSKTPGKWMSQSRVVNQKGFKASFGSIVLRSLIRITVIDAFFIPFLDKPLHDYLSKTELIQD